MGVKERRQRERTQVREKILDAALDVFAKGGAEGVTMRALADAIEYSPPVIYAHFRDKEAIIQELCYRQLRSLAQLFAGFGALDPVERLRRIGYVYADFAVDNPSHFRFLFLMPHAFSTDEAELAKDDPERNAYGFLKQTV
jgi:AcrR family transcriptional regulator